MQNKEDPSFLKPYQVEHVAMEAITSIKPIYRRLVDEGYEVHVAHPKEARSISRAKIKPYRTSSKALTELLRLDSLP